MKCSRCGHRARTLAAMAAHCRKKHPGAMKRKVTSAPRQRVLKQHQTGSKFCPHCGGFLG